MFEYRVIEIPNAPDTRPGDWAKYLEELVNFAAHKGWEFFRIDSLGIPRTDSIGDTLGVCQVIIFRRIMPAPTQEVVPATRTGVEIEPQSVEVFEESEPPPVLDKPTDEKPWWR